MSLMVCVCVKGEAHSAQKGAARTNRRLPGLDMAPEETRKEFKGPI